MADAKNTIVCIGTGPSLTMRQVDVARAKGFRLFGCNNVIFDVPDLELLYACNLGWWDQYYGRVMHVLYEQAQREHPLTDLWTTNPIAAKRDRINHIREINKPGLSTFDGLIHHGHGSGYSLVSMAHKFGAERIILLGYDLKYAKDYDGKSRNIGSTPRHYFDEYPSHLQHFPSVKVKDGIHIEMLELYQSIKTQGLVEIINCTSDTALECFERMPIEEVDGTAVYLPGDDDE